MTKKKAKSPDKVLSLALDTIAMEVERMHDLVEDGYALDTRDASTLTDYTKTLLTASSAVAKQDPMLKDIIKTSPEQLSALAKEALQWIDKS